MWIRVGDFCFLILSYHRVLRFEDAFAGHHVAEGGHGADLDGEGDALGDLAVRRSREADWGCDLFWRLTWPSGTLLWFVCLVLLGDCLAVSFRTLSLLLLLLLLEEDMLKVDGFLVLGE
jgi:hypothetical protein